MPEVVVRMLVLRTFAQAVKQRIEVTLVAVRHRTAELPNLFNERIVIIRLPIYVGLCGHVHESEHTKQRSKKEVDFLHCCKFRLVNK